MGLFARIIKAIFGPPHIGGSFCPRCGKSERWNGKSCDLCNYPFSSNRQSLQTSSDRKAGSPTSQPSGDAASSSGQASDGLAAYDAQQFAPLSHAEFSEQAGEIGRGVLTAGWFMRDRIPPKGDPRSELIERAMVGQGITSPAELEELHTLGAEYDRLKPTMTQAYGRGEAAVNADKAQRAEIRRLKKEEAAQCREAHAKAVAERKATDIVYLGRGVSRGLADRRTHVEKLEALKLPVLATPGDVAEAMGVTIPQLRWLCFHNEAATRLHYVAFTVPKKSGGERTIHAPMPQLARAQQWVLHNVLANVPTHDATHGFVPGRNTVSNAQPHVGQQVLINVDLKDFFPSISFARVRGLFKQLGYSPAVATMFALLCTEAPRRAVGFDGEIYHVAIGPRACPQGACTSPAISNLIARRLDSRLAGLAGKMGWTYTRYADDLSFSAGHEGCDDQVGYVLARLRHITQDEGFAINPAKTRVLRPNAQQRVTGIVVNQRPGVPRKTIRQLRAILHNAQYTGLAAQNRHGHPDFEGWLRGMIAYVQMVNPDQARPLWEGLDKLER